MAIGEMKWKPKGVEPSTVMWPLFAHELAVGRIPPEWVIYALENTQSWHGDDWTRGGTIELKVLPPNYSRKIPAVWDDAAFSLRNKILGKMDMPKGESGFVPPVEPKSN